MGRNILSICDKCEVYVFHLRGKESDYMQRFQNDHSDHENMTRIVSDWHLYPQSKYSERAHFLTGVVKTPTPVSKGLKEHHLFNLVVRG